MKYYVYRFVYLLAADGELKRSVAQLFAVQRESTGDHHPFDQPALYEKLKERSQGWPLFDSTATLDIHMVGQYDQLSAYMPDLIILDLSDVVPAERPATQAQRVRDISRLVMGETAKLSQQVADRINAELVKLQFVISTASRFKPSSLSPLVTVLGGRVPPDHWVWDYFQKS